MEKHEILSKLELISNCKYDVQVAVIITELKDALKRDIKQLPASQQQTKIYAHCWGDGIIKVGDLGQQVKCKHCNGTGKLRAT